MNERTFPRDVLEAVAYLYVQAQDLRGQEPKEILGMFLTAHKELTEAAEHLSKDVAAQWNISQSS